MRIAYLILAHDNPSHLKTLTSALNDFDDRIFIHINKKSNIQQFKEVAQQHHVSIIPNRTTIHWGGFSMLQAVFNLLYAAREASIPFQRYCLISGSDYPLRNNQKIHSYFEKYSEYEFINIRDIFQKEKIHLLPRLKYFVFETGLTRETTLNKIFFQINDKVLKTRLFTRNYQRHLGSLKPYIGDAWWILSDRMVSYMLHFIETHPQVVDFYRHTAHPLEALIHTIIGNSPFFDCVRHNVTYTDWLPRSTSPCFLTDDHIDFLEKHLAQTESVPGQKAFLFARKFSQDRQDLLSRIDRNLRDIHVDVDH